MTLRRTAILALYFLLGTVFLSSNLQASDADATLELDGQVFNVLFWEFAVSNSSTVHGGGGGGSGASSFGNLVLETTSGQLSVKMLELAASGTHVPTAVLTDGNLTLEMEDVIATFASVSKPDRHRLQLQFASYTYFTPSMSTCWDIPSNSAGSC